MLALPNENEYKELIKENLITYNKVTGISGIIIDSSGKTVFSAGECYEFCNSFRDFTGERCPCDQSHLYASKQSEKIAAPYIFFCPAGLVHWCATITVNGLFKNAFVCGPIQMGYPDDFSAEEIIKAHMLDSSSVDILNKAIKMVPVIDTERVRYLANMLYLIAKDIMTEENELLREKKKYYDEQSIINDKIRNIKKLSNDEHISSYYPVNLEKELVSKVKVGDITGAKSILNDLLSHVLFSGGNNIEVTKSRILELMIVLSRAAVEGGANLEMIFGMNLEFLTEVNQINSIEEICHWIIKVLERFMASIVSLENAKNSQIIQSAITYINENISKDITLESISSSVYLSPSYFSRLFKKEMNINFTDYLNKVRVEESKRYLPQLNYSLSEIASLVGFADQSHFTKVFKKIEGITPGKYRKMV